MSQPSPKGPKPIKPRRRWWLYVGIGLFIVSLVLLFGAWLGLRMAKERIEDELSQRLARVGWSLESIEIEIEFSGHVELGQLELKGPEGAHISVERISAEVDFWRALDGERPERFEISGVRGFVSRAGIEATLEARQRNSSSRDSASDSALGLELLVSDAEIALATQSELGVVGLVGDELALKRDDEGWHAQGRGALSLDETHRLEFEASAIPQRSWGHLKLNFFHPLQLDTSRGRAALGGLDLELSREMAAGTLFDIHFQPIGIAGVEELTIERISALFLNESGWELASLNLTQPTARIDLPALLRGPVGARYPRLVTLG